MDSKQNENVEMITINQGLIRDFQTLEELSRNSIHVTLGTIVNHFGTRAHLILIILFSIPFNQPLPLLGLSTPIGLFIAIVSALYAIDKPIKLPRKLNELKIPATTLIAICDASVKILKKSGKFIYPRFILKKSFAIRRWLVGSVLSASALLLCLPLPIPFSNMIPALVITTLALAEVEGDGALMLLAAFLFFGCLVFFGLIIYGPVLGLRALT